MNKKKIVSIILGATMLTSSMAGITSATAVSRDLNASGTIHIIDDGIPDNKNIGWDYNEDTKVLTFLGKGAIPDYPDSDNVDKKTWFKKDEVTEATKIVISNGITKIGSNCFNGMADVEEVDAPTVKQIGSNAFNGCEALSTLSVPSIQSVGSYAFNDCKSLSTFTAGKNMTYIGDYAFNNCESLRSVTGDGKVRVRNYSFSNCSSLTTFNLPNATEIGSYCFDNSSLLRTVKVPKATIKSNGFSTNAEQGVSTVVAGSLDNKAFYQNKRIKNLTLDNATFIGNYALAEATGLSTITANKVTSVGSSAFKDTNITEVNLRKVSKIDNYAFAGCKKLVKANLGTKISSVGSGAFVNCSSLNSTITLKNATSIGTNAFANCQNIRVADNSLGNKLKSIGSNAFAGCNKISSLYIPKTTTTIGSNLSSKIESVNDTSVTVTSNTERIKIYTPYNSTIYKKYIANKHNKSYIRKAVTSLKLSKSSVSLSKGKKVKLTWTITSNANNKGLTFITDNTKVATFSTSGYITAKGKGTCYVSIKSRDGSNKVAKCKVIVK